MCIKSKVLCFAVLCDTNIRALPLVNYSILLLTGSFQNGCIVLSSKSTVYCYQQSGCKAYHYWKLIPVVCCCNELWVDSDQWYSHLNCMCMYEDTQWCRSYNLVNYNHNNKHQGKSLAQYCRDYNCRKLQSQKHINNNDGHQGKLLAMLNDTSNVFWLLHLRHPFCQPSHYRETECCKYGYQYSLRGHQCWVHV